MIPNTIWTAIGMDIEAERQVQRGRWGDEHDDVQPEAWWANAIAAYDGYVQQAVFSHKVKPTDEAQFRYEPVEDAELRTALIKLVTTGIAWIEVIDRRSSEPHR